MGVNRNRLLADAALVLALRPLVYALVLAGRVVGLLSGLTRSLETRTDLVRALLPYALSATRPRPPRA